MREEEPLRAQERQQRSQPTMGVIETSRMRSAEDAGHVTDAADRGGVQPDPGSIDDSMQDAMRDAVL